VSPRIRQVFRNPALPVVLVPLALVGTGLGALLARTAGPRSDRVSQKIVYVDEHSIGGRCDNSRRVAQARSPRTPLCSIAVGITQAGPGGLVLVRSGTYPPLEIHGHRGPTTTIEADRSEGVQLPSITVDAGAGFLRFSRVTVTGSPSGDSVALLDGSHDIQVVNCNIASQMQDAVALHPAVRNVVIASNYIHTRPPGATVGGTAITFLSTSILPGSPPNEANEAPVSNVTILNNRLDHIGTDGIRPTNFVNLSILGNNITGIQENGEHTDAIQTVFGGRNLTIADNFIHDNRGEGILIKDGLVTNARIVNNVFVHTRLEYQLQVFGAVGLVIANNTFFDNELGVVLRPGIQHAVVENNIFDNLSAVSPDQIRPFIEEDYNLVQGGYGWPFGPHDIHRRPRFVDPVGNDFRLAAGSPGIDAGDGDVAPRFDKACRPRYDDPHVRNSGIGSPPYVDLGALEFGPQSRPSDTSAGASHC
jgi:hypothetical protein